MSSGLFPIVRPQQPVMPFWMGNDQDNERWEVVQGDSLARFIQMFCECQLVPDITGWFFIWTVKGSLDPNDPNVLAQVVWKEKHGLCSATCLIAGPTVTAAIPEGRWAWDLKYKTVTGSVATIRRGELDVLPSTNLNFSSTAVVAPASPPLTWNWLWLNLGNNNVPASQEAIDSWLVGGGSIRLSWGLAQPTQPSAPTSDPNDPSYDWSFMDSEIARWTAIGKKLLLRIIPQGTNAPAWVYTLPGMQSYTDALGLTTWIWWDEVARPYHDAMITAFAARYGNNPAVVLVSVNIVCTNSGDWNIPGTKSGVAKWTLASSFACPPFGGTVVVTPAPNQTIYAGWQVFINSFGYFKVLSFTGSPHNATSVLLQNMGLPGNANSGTVSANKVMVVNDTNNLLSAAVGFTTQRLVDAQLAVTEIATDGFQGAYITQEVGENNPSLVTPTNANTVAETLGDQGSAQFGTQFVIQRNNFGATSPPPPAIGTYLYILSLLENIQRGGQTNGSTYGNKNLAAAPLTIMTNTFNLALLWGLHWFEVYEVDVIGLTSQWVEPPKWGVTSIFMPYKPPTMQMAKILEPPTMQMAKILELPKPQAVESNLKKIEYQSVDDLVSLSREKVLRDQIRRQNAVARLT